MNKCERYTAGIAMLEAVSIYGNFWQKFAAQMIIKYMKDKYGSECDKPYDIAMRREKSECYLNYCEDIKNA